MLLQKEVPCVVETQFNWQPAKNSFHGKCKYSDLGTSHCVPLKSIRVWHSFVLWISEAVQIISWYSSYWIWNKTTKRWLYVGMMLYNAHGQHHIMLGQKLWWRPGTQLQEWSNFIHKPGEIPSHSFVLSNSLATGYKHKNMWSSQVTYPHT